MNLPSAQTRTEPVPPEATPHPGGWRPARLLSAPHRLGFFFGALWLATSALWWGFVLLARSAAWPLPWAVPPPAAHGLTLALSFMPLFMIGFLFTAGPRWLGLPDVAARRLLVPVLAMALGWGLALPGFHLHALVAAAGVASVTLGWAAVTWRFVQLVRRSQASDRMHATVIASAATLGVVALATATAALALGHADLVRAASLLALWGFLAPVFATVAHRMIPFFTVSVLPELTMWRPRWLLALMLLALGVTAAGEAAQALWWPLPAAVHFGSAAVQGPIALLLLWVAWRWGVVQSWRNRLLAMLQVGFVWLGLALALAAASHLRVALWGEAASLGLAPLHSLTMGYLGSTLLAMATRVAAGHSGRPVAADRVAWRLYWLLQAAAGLRVASALWPAVSAAGLLAAAAAWALACTGWAWRYGRWLGAPRVDGRPG